LETFIVDSLEDPMVVVFVSYLSLCSLVFRVRYFSFKERVETVLFMKIQNPREREERQKEIRARAEIYHIYNLIKTYLIYYVVSKFKPLAS
jgi:hypothetical protein